MEALEYVQKDLNYIQLAQAAATASSIHYKYDIKFKIGNGKKVAIKSRRANEVTQTPEDALASAFARNI